MSQEKILEYIKQFGGNKSFTSKEIGERFGITTNKAGTYLRKLYFNKQLERRFVGTQFVYWHEKNGNR